MRDLDSDGYEDFIQVLSDLASENGIDLNYEQSIPVHEEPIKEYLEQVRGWSFDYRGEARVESIAKAMKDGEILPPIIVIDGKVVDGRHRLLAADALGKTSITVIHLSEKLMSYRSPREVTVQNKRFVPIKSFTLAQILKEVDPNHIHHAQYTSELEEPFVIRVYGSTMLFGTKSSKYAKNHTIWKQKVIFKDFVVIARDKEIPIGQAVRYAIENLDMNIRCQCPAQCFTGDTQVMLLDGTTASMAEIDSRVKSGEELWVYGADVKGDFVPDRITASRVAAHVNELVEVTLDNGEVIRCTDDHPFMLRDGSFLEAGELVEGTSLMPLYRAFYRGYEKVQLNSTGKLEATHLRVAKEVHKDSLVSIDQSEGVVVHHRNFKQSDNTPSNLEWMRKPDHIKFHRDLIHKNRDKMNEGRRRYLANGGLEKARAASSAGAIRVSESHSARMIKYHADLKANGYDYSAQVAKASEGSRINNSMFKTDNIILMAVSRVMSIISEAPTSSDFEKVVATKKKKFRWESFFKSYDRARYWYERLYANYLTAYQKEAPRLEMLSEIREVYEARWVSRPCAICGETFTPRLADQQTCLAKKCYSELKSRKHAGAWNHKVKSVRKVTLERSVPVYDITTEKTHVFTLAAGVIVHNCFWGYSYMGTQLNYLYGLPREGRFPKIRNPNLRGTVCKHSDKVMRWIMENEEEIVRYFEQLYRNVDFAKELERHERENPDLARQQEAERRAEEAAHDQAEAEAQARAEEEARKSAEFDAHESRSREGNPEDGENSEGNPDKKKGAFQSLVSNTVESGEATYVFSASWKLRSKELIRDLVPTKMKGRSLLKMLKRHGVSNDEILYTDLDRFLGTDHQVSAEEVIAHMEENGVNLSDVKLVKPTPDKNSKYYSIALASFFDKADAESFDDMVMMLENDGDLYRRYMRYPELADDEYWASTVLNSVYPNFKDPARYSKYSTPGGRDYTEMLHVMDTPFARFKERMRKKYSKTADDYWQKLMTPEELDTYSRLARERSGRENQHWWQENVIAHSRFSVRAIHGFGRTLLVDEIQSDWHQAGKSRGYRDPRDPQGSGDSDRFLRETWKKQVTPLIKDLVESYRVRAKSAAEGLARRFKNANFVSEPPLDTVIDGIADAALRGEEYRVSLHLIADSIEEVYPVTYDVGSTVTVRSMSGNVVSFLNLEELTPSRLPRDLSDVIRDAKQKDHDYAKSVTHAPFSDTWVNMAFNRLVAEAIERDCKSLAWVDGDAQIRRYKELDEKQQAGMKVFYDDRLVKVATKFAKRYGTSVERASVTAGNGERNNVYIVRIDPKTVRDFEDGVYMFQEKRGGFRNLVRSARADSERPKMPSDEELREQYEFYQEVAPGILNGVESLEEWIRVRRAYTQREIDRYDRISKLTPEDSLEPEDLADRGFDEDDFLETHRTGHISPTAYKEYNTAGNWDRDQENWPGKFNTVESRPVKVGEITLKDGTVLDVRSSGERLQYTYFDEDTLTHRRDEEGKLLYRPDSELEAEGLPTHDTALYAFDGKQLAGVVSDEFGTDGIWVNPRYQGRGLGTQLLRMFRKQFKYPRGKIGQMTPDGENLTRAYFRRYGKRG